MEISNASAGAEDPGLEEQTHRGAVEASSRPRNSLLVYAAYSGRSGTVWKKAGILTRLIYHHQLAQGRSQDLHIGGRDTVWKNNFFSEFSN